MSKKDEILETLKEINKIFNDKGFDYDNKVHETKIAEQPKVELVVDGPSKDIPENTAYWPGTAPRKLKEMDRQI